MAEMVPPGAAPGDAATAAAPADGMAAHIAPAPLSVKALIEAGAHFGHQTHRWNPQMKPFIFGERNGIHIVDLDQTLARFRGALEFLRKTIANGGKVLFVGTKRQAALPVQAESARAGQFFVNNRWLGGMLTNFRTVKKSIERFKELLATMENAEESERALQEGALGHPARRRSLPQVARRTSAR